MAIHEMPASESTKEALTSHDQAMERIRHQTPNNRNLAETALGWLTCAARPLRTQELQVAVAIDEDDGLLEENIRPIGDFITACAGLVVVEQEGFHHSLVVWHGAESNLEIAGACVALLSSDWSGALIAYASGFWSHHLHRSPNAQRHDWVLDFLGSELITRALSRGELYYATSQATGLHLAAYFGLDVAVGAGIQRSYDPNAPGGWGWTPIFYAAKGDHCSTIKVLVRCGAKIDVRCRDDYNGWAIQEAVQRSLYNTVEVLLGLEAQLDPGVETWAYRDAKSLALQTAVVCGDGKMISLLLSHGASIDYLDKGNTALMWAAYEKGTAITRLLIDHGANINARGRDSETALMNTFSLSSDRLNIKQAEVLLENKADTDLCDSYG